MLKEFRDFAVKGNVLDMAIGIVIGGAFAPIVKSLVDDLLMPVIGLFLGGVDFAENFLVLKAGATAGPYATLAAAREAGAVTMNWGIFINAIITFVIVAFAIFMMIKTFNRWKKEEEAAPAEPPKDLVLLEEIRDALKARG
ncbi:MAG: large conductance mechanosensitive channel protein MscL [Acidobacteriota bacterium]|nr:large conductance mechanosensitive channel protein MscL [Acidobacteriota bacterium]MDH3524924.1 large conductance mechanosensitive channel protein MscL [Acidobacteriota bacterium]